MTEDRPRYGDDDFDYEGLAMREWEDDRHSRPATESEAHQEWHINAGIPMGTPGCPWDACHAEPDEEIYWVHETFEPAEEIPFAEIVPDEDDIPF